MLSLTMRCTLILAAAAIVSAQQTPAPRAAAPAAGQAAAPASGARTFATPGEAVVALLDAAEHNDTPALLKLFGPQGADIVQSGDPAEDKANRAEFARRLHEKMTVRMDSSNPNRAEIVAGAQDWPFPVPLIRDKATGRWHFDAERGKTEILARRVGRNELVAIDVCRGYVEAQMEYAGEDRDANGMLEYARKITSSPGKKDGLYWEGESGRPGPQGIRRRSSRDHGRGQEGHALPRLFFPHSDGSRSRCGGRQSITTW